MTRLIENRVELNQLHEGSVVLDRAGVCWQYIEDYDFGPLHWHNTFRSELDAVGLPAKVLYEPGKSGTADVVKVEIVKTVKQPEELGIVTISGSTASIYERGKAYAMPAAVGHIVAYADGSVKFWENRA